VKHCGLQFFFGHSATVYRLQVELYLSFYVKTELFDKCFVLLFVVFDAFFVCYHLW